MGAAGKLRHERGRCRQLLGAAGSSQQAAPCTPSPSHLFSSPLLNKTHSLPYYSLVLSECWWKVIK